MSRCIACNAVLSYAEMCAHKPDGEYEDMCKKCLVIVEELTEEEETE